MIVMALIALFGLVALVLLYFFFVSRGASQRAAAQTDVEHEVSLKLRKAQDIDSDFVKAIIAGAAVDQAIADYQRGRAAVLSGEKTDQAWAWTPEDLDVWKKREIRRRLEEVNRRLLLPAVATSLLAVTLTLAAIVVYYQFMSTQAGVPQAAPGAAAPASLPPPVLPPSPPLPPSGPQAPAASSQTPDMSP